MPASRLPIVIMAVFVAFAAYFIILNIGGQDYGDFANADGDAVTVDVDQLVADAAAALPDDNARLDGGDISDATCHLVIRTGATKKLPIAIYCFPVEFADAEVAAENVGYWYPLSESADRVIAVDVAGVRFLHAGLHESQRDDPSVRYLD